jgi:putative addiction module component (TIGR02574 family)
VGRRPLSTPGGADAIIKLMSKMSKIEIEKLSPQERLELIGRLCDSLDAEDVPLTPAQAAELDRRLEAADADLAASVPWETLKAERGSSRR